MKINKMVARNSLIPLLPKRVRSVFKRVSANLNLYDERAARLGLHQLHKDDTFIVSYPKSGNTWVKFLIANMLEPTAKISFRNIDQFVPGIPGQRKLANAMQRPRFIKDHRPMYACHSRFIYIYRDGRDVLVSYYYYSKQRATFAGTFSEFLHSPILQTYGYWHEHVSKAVNYAQQHPGRVLLIQYEQMLKTPIECAHQITDFCQLSTEKSVIEDAVNRCAFQKMQKMEKQFGPERTREPNVQFFRSGQAGSWRTMFSKADLQLFQSMAGHTLRRLGYLDS